MLGKEVHAHAAGGACYRPRVAAISSWAHQCAGGAPTAGVSRAACANVAGNYCCAARCARGQVRTGSRAVRLRKSMSRPDCPRSLPNTLGGASLPKSVSRGCSPLGGAQVCRPGRGGRSRDPHRRPQGRAGTGGAGDGRPHSRGSQFCSQNGAPGKIRTPDPQIRSLVLYPAELPVLRPRPNGLGGSGRSPRSGRPVSRCSRESPGTNSECPARGAPH